MRMTPVVLALAASLICGGTVAAPDASEISRKINELAMKLGVIGVWDFHFERLPRVKQVLFAIWVLEGEVYNGGLRQYFLNSSGRLAPQVGGILDSIGAGKAALILKTAIEALGPDIPWDDEAKRGPIINALSEATKKRLYSLDNQLADQFNEINLLLFHYLSQHRDQIDVPSEFWTGTKLQ